MSVRRGLVLTIVATTGFGFVRPVSADPAWQTSDIQVVSGPVPGLPAPCTGVTSEGETFLAAAPGNMNHLVAVWSAGANDGPNTSITSVSRDGGTTWSRAAVPGTGPCTGGPGDWVIDQWTAVGPDGRAYYESFAGHNPPRPFDAQTLVSSSPSGGNGWPAATVLDDNLQGARGVISRTSITADPQQQGRAWAVWSRLLNPAFQGVFVARTDDGGATWQPPIKVADVVGGAAAAWQLVVRGDGGLVLFYGELDTTATIQGGVFGQDVPALARAVRSDDGGQTWSSPSTVAHLPAYRLVRAAAGPDGNLYLVWSELNDTTALVVVARSNDGGTTWGAPITIASFPAGPLGSRYVAPDIAANPDGAIGVSYYNGAAANGQIARWFAHSTDGGATWTTQPLSDPFAFDTGSGGTGDGPQGAYQGLAPVGNGFGALFIVGTGQVTNPTDVAFVRITPKPSH